MDPPTPHYEETQGKGPAARVRDWEFRMDAAKENSEKSPQGSVAKNLGENLQGGTLIAEAGGGEDGNCFRCPEKAACKSPGTGQSAAAIP